MPSRPTVLRWVEDFPEFRTQYARAREAQADHYAEEILDISDDGENDWMCREGKDKSESWQLNGEHVQRSKLRVDSRKWLMSKLAPKKYGDKVTQELVGPGGGPVQIERRIVDPTNPDS